MFSEEKVKVLSQKLLDAVRQTFESNRFKQYLKAMSVLHQYSSRNITLIFLQNPNATHVAGFDAWKKFGRYVRRGETGISIFAPVKIADKTDKPVLDDNGNSVLDENGTPKTQDVENNRIHFHPVTVFDVSQTDGESLPALCNELQSAALDFQTIFSAIQNLSPYKIVFGPMRGQEKGYCSHTERKIALKSGMSDAQIVKTLIHEYAHAVIHKDTGKSREQRKIEAESAAFIVSDFLGIDTSGYSFDYVSVWSHGMNIEQLQDVLENIQTGANEIIFRIDAGMKALEQMRNTETRNLPERLTEAVKKSEKLNAEKEMIPSGKLLAE